MKIHRNLINIHGVTFFSKNRTFVPLNNADKDNVDWSTIESIKPISIGYDNHDVSYTLIPYRNDFIVYTSLNHLYLVREQDTIIYNGIRYSKRCLFVNNYYTDAGGMLYYYNAQNHFVSLTNNSFTKSLNFPTLLTDDKNILIQLNAIMSELVYKQKQISSQIERLENELYKKPR